MPARSFGSVAGQQGTAALPRLTELRVYSAVVLHPQQSVGAKIAARIPRRHKKGSGLPNKRPNFPNKRLNVPASV